MKKLSHSALLALLFVITNGTFLSAQNETWRHKGNVIHNGEAIFPIGYWMEFNEIEKKESAVEVLGNSGFDMITYGVPKSLFGRLTNVFNTADAYDVRVAYGLFGSTAPISPNLSPADDVIFTDQGNNIRNNPSFLGYYHSDDVFRLTAKQLNDKQELVKRLDNDHLTFHSSSAAIFSTDPEYVSSADAPGVQSYPVSSAWLHNTYVGTLTLVKASRLWDKVPVLHGQTTNNNDFFKDGQRWLTPSEFDAHTYLGVIAGAKSIFYYTFGKTNVATENGLNIDKPDIWEKSIQIKNELRSIEQVLLFGQLHFSPFNPNYDVYYGYWIFGDKVYVIVVNSFQEVRGNAERYISIEDLPNNVSNLKPLFKNNGRRHTLSLNGNILEGLLQPTDVQVYTLDYKDPIVLNGNFNDKPVHWDISGTAEIRTEGKNKFLKANATPNATSIKRDLRYRILPNRNYTLKADLKSDRADGGVTVFVQFRDYKDNIIATHNIGATTRNWKTKSVSFKAPNVYGTAVVGVWRRKNSTGDAFVDNISVFQGASSKIVASKSVVKNSDTSLLVFPNPTKDVLQLNSELFQNTIKEINIFNLQGKIVRRFTANDLPAVTEPVLDVSAMGAGMYILNITFSQGTTKSTPFVIKN
ncbi:T9SS type A sorting domain-containing protein [Maribacter sp. 2-571]|uniref:T9SS type A sorting domain-containing protein n=1 Tax=Maribacter sp. 2-571 TaxID=3417569 RepID=UPI003D3597CE